MNNMECGQLRGKCYKRKMYKIITIFVTLWAITRAANVKSMPSRRDGYQEHNVKLASSKYDKSKTLTFQGEDRAQDIPDTSKLTPHYDRLTRNIERGKRSEDDGPRIDALTASSRLTECAVVDNKCPCYNNEITGRASINCRYQFLYEIPKFKHMDTIYYQIDFSKDNFIKTIPNNTFQNLKVEKIDLLENQLFNVQTGAFNGLEPYLQELLLEGGGDMINPVPFESMTRLSNLRKLTLKNFKLDYISNDNLFGSFPNLQKLTFIQMSLQHIDSEAFKDKLANLQEIYFEKVKFSDIPVAGLSHLQSLQTLHIRNTKPITTVYSDSFENMRNLEDLNLSHDLIQNIEIDAFLGVSNNIKFLDLSSNNLQPKSLEALASKSWPMLEHLDLSYNYELTSMQENVFQHMTNLQYLRMEHVNLKHISRYMFKGLDNLFALDISWNVIETIQDSAFSSMNNLGQLFMQQNGRGLSISLELMPSTLKGLEKSLVLLNLQNTMLKPISFWSGIATLTELTDLKIGFTGLKDIPNNAFAKNTKLENLLLDNNGITYLKQGAFDGLENVLRKINLNGNNITTINKCVFDKFTGLNLIHLQNNPLFCDCRLKWLYTRIKASANIENFYKEEYKCAQPSIYAGQFLYNISTSDFTCSTHIEEQCTAQTTVRPTGQPPTQKPTPSPDAKVRIMIPSRTAHSVTVAWEVTDKSQITGYKLNYKQTTQQDYQPVYKHRSEFTHVLQNLQPGTFYEICVLAEIQQSFNENTKDCTTQQTLGESNNNSDQQQDPDDSSYGATRNTTIGIIIATTAAIILISVGVCAVVKYKVQKIKEIGKNLERLHGPYDRSPYYITKEGRKCVVQNEYSDIEEAKIACKYQAKNPRMIQRQFGLENPGFEEEMNPNPYGSYYKIGTPTGLRRMRRNPYENDDEDDFDVQQVKITDDSTVVYKSDLTERHSAPSRLDAKDLKKQQDMNSRPLPATPSDQNPGKQKRCSTLKPMKKGDKSRKQDTVSVVTLATVHGNK